MTVRKKVKRANRKSDVENDIGINATYTTEQEKWKDNNRIDPWDQLRRAASATGTVITAAEHLEHRRKANRKGPRLSKDVTLSRQDPLVIECRRLLKERVRRRENVVRIEGLAMIRTALDFGWVPDIILCGRGPAVDLERCEELQGREITICSDDIVRATMVTPRLDPAVAFGPVPEKSPLRGGPRRALLLGMQDPNNIGSLLRTGLAMGIDTVFTLPGTPDPFHPAVLRTSAGAALGLRYGTEAEAVKCGLPVIAATAHGGRDSVKGINPTQFMLALGHETRGLPTEWLDCGRSVTLPLHFESLGVAVAGAILLDRIIRDE